MLPPSTYVDKNLENKRAYQFHMNLHYKKMQLISDSKDAKVHAVPHVAETRALSQALKKRQDDLKRAHDFAGSEQNSEINRNNQILLSKLIQISNGKGVGVPVAPHRSIQGGLPPLAKSMQGSTTLMNAAQTSKSFYNRSNQASVNIGQQSHQSSSSHVLVSRSLNIGARRLEASKIERENLALAKRLYDKTPQVSRSTLQSEWSTHQKYLGQLKKVKCAPHTAHPTYMDGKRTMQPEFMAQSQIKKSSGRRKRRFRYPKNAFQEEFDNGNGTDEQDNESQEEDRHDQVITRPQAPAQEQPKSQPQQEQQVQAKEVPIVKEERSSSVQQQSNPKIESNISSQGEKQTSAQDNKTDSVKDDKTAKSQVDKKQSSVAVLDSNKPQSYLAGESNIDSSAQLLSNQVPGEAQGDEPIVSEKIMINDPSQTHVPPKVTNSHSTVQEKSKTQSKKSSAIANSSKSIKQQAASLASQLNEKSKTQTPTLSQAASKNPSTSKGQAVTRSQVPLKESTEMRLQEIPNSQEIKKDSTLVQLNEASQSNNNVVHAKSSMLDMEPKSEIPRRESTELRLDAPQSEVRKTSTKLDNKLGQDQHRESTGMQLNVPISEINEKESIETQQQFINQQDKLNIKSEQVLIPDNSAYVLRKPLIDEQTDKGHSNLQGQTEKRLKESSLDKFGRDNKQKSTISGNRQKSNKRSDSNAIPSVASGVTSQIKKKQEVYESKVTLKDKKSSTTTFAKPQGQMQKQKSSLTSMTNANQTQKAPNTNNVQTQSKTEMAILDKKSEQTSVTNFKADAKSENKHLINQQSQKPAESDIGIRSADMLDTQTEEGANKNDQGNAILQDESSKHIDLVTSKTPDLNIQGDVSSSVINQDSKLEQPKAPYESHSEQQ